MFVWHSRQPLSCGLLLLFHLFLDDYLEYNVGLMAGLQGMGEFGAFV